MTYDMLLEDNDIPTLHDWTRADEPTHWAPHVPTHDRVAACDPIPQPSHWPQADHDDHEYGVPASSESINQDNR